jgi:hypothetical protein
LESSTCFEQPCAHPQEDNCMNTTSGIITLCYIRNCASSWFVCFWRNSPQWARASSFTRYLDHTQRRTAVGRTPLEEWSARRRDLCLTTHNTHNKKMSIPPVGFEPTIAAAERPQTHASDRAASGPRKLSSLRDLIYRLLTPFLNHMNTVHIFILSCHLRLGLHTDFYHKLSPHPPPIICTLG